MIRKFVKDTTYSEYHNIIELYWLFILSEIVEYFILFNAYDVSRHEYNIRRIFWVVSLTMASVGFVLLLTTTCITYLLKVFGAI